MGVINNNGKSVKIKKQGFWKSKKIYITKLEVRKIPLSDTVIIHMLLHFLEEGRNKAKDLLTVGVFTMLEGLDL